MGRYLRVGRVERSNGMTKVIVDDVLSAKLNGLREQVQLCDATGQFLPESVYLELLSASDDMRATDDELDRRRREPARPLTENWNSLGRQ